MVTLSKLYTRTGDDGSTGLVDGSRIGKDDLRVEAYGEVDELNAWVGALRTRSSLEGRSDWVAVFERISQELFDIGAALATPPGFDKYPVFEPTHDHLSWLEAQIDEALRDLRPLDSFVLPGGTFLNAELHLARTVCRRTERRIIALSRQSKVHPLVIQYLNRLSDLFFAFARRESHHAGGAEYLWVPHAKRRC